MKTRATSASAEALVVGDFLHLLYCHLALKVSRDVVPCSGFFLIRGVPWLDILQPRYLRSGIQKEQYGSGI